MLSCLVRFPSTLCAPGVGSRNNDRKKGCFGIDSLRLFVLTAWLESRLRFNRPDNIMARVARVLAWNVCFCRSTDVFVAALEHARTKSLVPLNISWYSASRTMCSSSLLCPSPSWLGYSLWKLLHWRCTNYSFIYLHRESLATGSWWCNKSRARDKLPMRALFIK